MAKTPGKKTTKPAKKTSSKQSAATKKAPAHTTPKSRQPAAPSKKGGDGREEALGRMRSLILEADPEMIEERKWRKPSNGMVGVPVWSHNGIVCTGGEDKGGGERTGG